MNLNVIEVNTSKVAIRMPQVYIICILSPEALVYVGQTCQMSGVLGRFCQHMTGGTLTEILKREGIAEFDNVSVISIRLSEYGIFNDVYSRKREALEYLIQREMKLEGCKTLIPFKVISRVQYNSEVNNPQIVRLAKNIVKNIADVFPFNK